MGHESPHQDQARRDGRPCAQGRPLTRDQERSLWLHRAVAGKLAADPDSVMAIAEGNLTRLAEIHPSGMAARWLGRWRETFDGGLDDVFEALTTTAERAVELRQNTPSAAVLSEPERAAVLAAFRAHWRTAHTA